MEEWIIKLKIKNTKRYAKHKYINMIDITKTYQNIFVNKTPTPMELYDFFNNTKICYHRNWI